MITGLLSYLDINDPLVRENPYATYNRLRKEGPIFEYSPGEWLVIGFGAARQVLLDEAFVTVRSADTRLVPARRIGGGVLPLLAKVDHDWLRPIVSAALSRRQRTLLPFLANLADELAEAAALRGHFDLIRDLAVPLPHGVLSEILGVDLGDPHDLRARTAEISLLLDPGRDGEPKAPAMKAGLRLFRLAEQLVSRAQAGARPGLIADLISVARHEPRLTPEMIVSVILVFLFAGQETTANLIGLGLRALLLHRDQYEVASDAYGDSRNTVNELLRFDSPVQSTVRIANEARSLSGRRIGRGDSLLVLIGAANRDPQQFIAPNVLDVGRADTTHLTFSVGSHTCLGAQLGRLEAQSAINSVCRHMPNLRIAGEISFRRHFTMRGIERLLVESP